MDYTKMSRSELEEQLRRHQQILGGLHDTRQRQEEELRQTKRSIGRHHMCIRLIRKELDDK